MKDRSAVTASSTHQVRLSESLVAEALSVTDLPAFTAEHAPTQADAVDRLITVLAEFEILDHDTPAAALIQINNISGSRYGTLLLSADRIDEIVTALQAVLDGKSGGAR